MRSWSRVMFWRAGLCLVAVSLIAGIAMQAVSGEWFPPPVSISQYGVGRWGWLFSVFAVSLSASPLLFERALARSSRPARVLLWIGLAGTLLMAVIRTDAGGAQLSWNAKVHMVGSIICLAFLPLGVCALMWRLGRVPRWIGIGHLVLLAISMTLLLFAAAGHDTAGRGSHGSWAFWQAVGVVLCVTITGSAVVAIGRSLERSMSDHTPQMDRSVAPAS